MTNYRLTDRQKDMIRALVPGLQDGTIKTGWTVAHGDGRIVAIGGFRNAEIQNNQWSDVNDGDLAAFVNCGFMNIEWRKQSQVRYTLNEGNIFHTVDNDFEDSEQPRVNHVTISAGDNSIINYQSTLTNVQQSIGAATPLSDSDKAQLTDLIEQFKKVLAGAELPEDEAEEAEAAAQDVKDAVDQLNAGKPNRKIIKSRVDEFERRIEIVGRIVPPIIAIGAKIALILRPFTM